MKRPVLDFGTTTVSVPVAEWGEHARVNRLKNTSSAAGAVSYRKTVREAIIQRARRWVTRDCASGTGATEFPPAGEDPPMILCGHQPVVYHPGVLYKNQLLSECAQQSGAVVLNVIIDTDSGDAGAIIFPRRTDAGALTLKQASLTEQDRVYLTQSLLPSDRLHALFGEIEESLEALGFRQASAGVARAHREYGRWAGRPAVEANTAVRRKLSGQQPCLEIPLSEILQIPEARQFFDRVLSDGSGFANSFNSRLIQFRMDRKIKNLANPFPNLMVQTDRVELPFWAIRVTDGVRAPLFMNPADGSCFCEGVISFRADREYCVGLLGVAGAEGVLLAPRAILITAFLRLVASDLFVHGLGGAKYDAFLDLLIPQYWDQEAPVFVVASATRQLFTAELAEMQATRERRERRREMVFRPEKFVDSPQFDEQVREEIRRLVKQRSASVENMRALRERGESAAVVTHEIKALDQQMKQMVSDALGPEEDDIPTGNEKLYQTREFPFFFFLEDS